MKKSGFDQYYDEAVEPGKRERAYAWATAIGLQDVDGLKPSKHLLATAKRHIEGEISQEEARRIVDEYYETKDGHDFFASGLNTDQRMRRKSQICIGEKMTMAWGVMRGVMWGGLIVITPCAATGGLPLDAQESVYYGGANC